MSQISSASGTSTLTAFFDSRDDAEDAVRRLYDAGIAQSSVRLVPGYENDEPVQDSGKIHKGFFESLADFFMPDEDRYSYAEGLSRGGYLVTVSDLPQSQYDIAVDILDDEGAINFDEREQSWRSEGWSGYTGDTYGSGATASGMGLGSAAGTDAGLGSSSTMSGDGSLGSTSSTTGSGYGTSGLSGTATDRSYGTDEVIPVVEEQLRIGKRDVNLGRVRVRSYVREEPISEQVNLRDERVTLERRPVDRPLTGDEAAFRDRTIEAEEHAEEAVVSKEARVVEEIGLRKETEQRNETVSDTVRHTEVEVEDERGIADRDISNRR